MISLHNNRYLTLNSVVYKLIINAAHTGNKRLNSKDNKKGVSSRGGEGGLSDHPAGIDMVHQCNLPNFTKTKGIQNSYLPHQGKENSYPKRYAKVIHENINLYPR